MAWRCALFIFSSPLLWFASYDTTNYNHGVLIVNTLFNIFSECRQVVVLHWEMWARSDTIHLGQHHTSTFANDQIQQESFLQANE
jgi:hypothetical protein